MDEVSCRAVLQVLDGMERLGFDAERAIRETSLDLSRLCDQDRMVSWDDLVDLHEAAERQGVTSADFEAIGESLPRLASAGTISRVARFAITPRQLYEVSVRWISPNLFPILRVERRVRGKEIIEFTLEIPRHRRGCESFFRVNLGATRVVPTMLGYSKAHIDAEIGPHTARFRVHLPSRTSLPQRLRLHARALFAPGAIIRELGRQQAEISERFEALIRARRDFRQVIERIPDVVVICRASDVIYANPASTRVLGLEGRRPLERAHFLDLVHDDDRATAARHLAATEAPVGSPPTRLRFHHASGDEILLELAPTQRIHFEGKPALLLVARDVTESRRLRDQLARADRLSSLGSLVATVGHELSNPLAYISLNLGVLDRILTRSTDTAGNDRAIDALRSARQGATRAREILRELTTFSRGTETQEPIPVHEVVDAAVALAGKEVEQRATLVKDYRPTPLVRANRGRLEQVIVNLLLNAAQSFTADGQSDKQVTIRTLAGDGDVASIEVEDNGAGMDEATRARVFDPFFSTKPAGEGTGLGLAICRDIVEENGGVIEVESMPGHGSRFIVRLPTHRANRENDPAVPAKS